MAHSLYNKFKKLLRALQTNRRSAMYKKYASKCIIVGMIFIFLTGCVSITESSPEEKGSKDFVRMEAENVLDVCIEQMQIDRVLLRTKTICQFYKAIDREELSEKEREAFCERLLEDNILRDGEFRMTACEISEKFPTIALGFGTNVRQET